MEEVWSFRYSAVALPCRWRAAPAKKRIWSTIGGISSARVTATGFPVFCVSTRTRSSARASMASAMRKRARLRSDGVASRHCGKASAAACMAASTSAGPDSGASRYSCPVLGSTSTVVAPSLVGMYSPPTKFDSRPAVVPDAGFWLVTRPPPNASPLVTRGADALWDASPTLCKVIVADNRPQDKLFLTSFSLQIRIRLKLSLDSARTAITGLPW